MISFLKTRIGISLICSLCIIGAALYIQGDNSPKNSSGNLVAEIQAVASQSVKKGLENGHIDTKSWEEELKKVLSTTTIDSTIALLGTDTGTTTPETLTATDRFAREFFMRYVELKNSGVAMDETTGVALVNELLTKDYGGPTGEPIYKATDIAILNTNQKSDLRAYANMLGQVLTKDVPQGYENELVILNRAQESGYRKDLPKLEQNIARYTEIRDEILVIPVPKSLTNAHLALINSLSFIIEGVRGMILLNTDPVGATRMVLKYQDGIKALEISTIELSTFFKKQGVTFSSSEPGNIFIE